MQTPVMLAVDFGTTHTVAVVGRGGQEPRTLFFDGSPLLASGVYLDAEGTLHTGRDAQRLGATDPERFEPYPKRRIDDGSILLGDKEIPVEELLATGLRRVAEEAAASGLGPTETVLTHPADWGPVRRRALERAADLAGLGPVRMVPEPIAAATYCATVLGQEIPRAGTVAIFDFGGGTFDVAVVRREDTGRLRTLAVGGLDDLGGLDVDMALAAHLGRVVAGRDPELWQRIDQPETTADLRDRLAFWAEVRAAKEMLSRTSTAPVALPGHNPMGLHLTRDELTSLADPLVARAVDETRRTIERAGVAPADLAAVLLVGGSSRMPMIATRLHSRLGVAPAVPEQPELPVAFGAYQYAATETDDADPTTPTALPVADYAPYPVPDLRAPAQTPPAPLPSPPASAQSPYTPAPSPPVPLVSSPYMPSPPTVSDPTPQQLPFTPQALPPRVHTGPMPNAGPPRRFLAFSVVSSIVTVIVVALVIALNQTDWDGMFEGIAGENPLSGLAESAGELLDTDPAPGLELVSETQLSTLDATAMTTAGGVAYIGEVSTGLTTVTAMDAAGTTLWTQEYELEPTDLHLGVVGDVLLLDAASSATDAGEDMRAAVALADGAFLWKQSWYGRSDVAFYGNEVIVEQRDGFEDNAVIRVDLLTGKQIWSKEGPYDLFIIDTYRARAEAIWDEGEGGPGTIPPNSYALHDNLAATDRLVELDPDEGTAVVRDAADGSAIHSGDLPLDGDIWTAYDGLAIGKLSDDASPGRAALGAFAIDGLDESWRIEFNAGFSIKNVKACGPQLVCAALDHSDASDQYKTIAINTRTGLQEWEIGVEWHVDEHWYSGPNGLVLGDQPFDYVSSAQLLGFDGTIRMDAELFQSVTALHGDLAVVESYGSERQITVVNLADATPSAAIPIGDDFIEHAAIDADLLTILTENGRALTYRIPPVF